MNEKKVEGIWGKKAACWLEKAEGKGNWVEGSAREVPISEDRPSRLELNMKCPFALTSPGISLGSYRRE